MGQNIGKADQETDEIVVRGGELHDEFQKMKDGKDRLSVAQLRKTIKREGADKKTLSEEDEKLNKLFPDNEKYIDFKGFLKWKMARDTRGASMAEILTELFNTSDDDGNGYLTPDELIKLEATLGVHISEAEAQQIINQYDSNGDGRMDLEEFILYKEAKL